MDAVKEFFIANKILIIMTTVLLVTVVTVIVVAVKARSGMTQVITTKNELDKGTTAVRRIPIRRILFNTDHPDQMLFITTNPLIPGMINSRQHAMLKYFNTFTTNSPNAVDATHFVGVNSSQTHSFNPYQYSNNIISRVDPAISMKMAQNNPHWIDGSGELIIYTN